MKRTCRARPHRGRVLPGDESHRTETAIRDAEGHGAYIAQFNPFAAARIIRRLFTAGNSLATFPKRGRARPDGARELAVVPPYILVYSLSEDAVHILRIWHGSQDRTQAD